MKKKLRKYLTFTVILLTFLSAFCLAGCRSPYNAEIIYDSYDNAGEWINEEFKKNNLTAGAYYADDPYYSNIATDDSFPKSRTFVIKSDEEKHDILNSNFDAEVNFEQEMLIVYTWSSVERRPSYIKSIELKGDVLYINYFIKPLPPGRGGTCMDYQRWFVIRLDLLSVSSVEIKEV